MADRFNLGVYFMFCCFLIGAIVKAKETVYVSVYYESLCPDSRRFIQNQLQKSYDKVSNSIKLELIPYGNAKTAGNPDDYTFNCQHGREECVGNTIQICAIKILNTTKEKLDFVSCAFEQSSQYHITKQCIQSISIQKKIRQCAEGPMGKNLLHKMGVLTDSLSPPHTFIPWITFNRKGGNELNDEAMANFEGTLCKFYKSEIPDFCQSHRKRMTEFYHRLVGL